MTAETHGSVFASNDCDTKKNGILLCTTHTHTHTHTLQRFRQKKAFHDMTAETHGSVFTSNDCDTKRNRILHTESMQKGQTGHTHTHTHIHTRTHTEVSSTHKFISHLKVTNATLSNFSKYFRKSIVVPCRGPDPVRVKWGRGTDWCRTAS